MRVLITGATGVLAGEVIRQFEKSSMAQMYLTSRSRVQHANHIYCDLTQPSSIKKIIAELKPNLVFHLAGSYENNLALDFPVNSLSAGIIAEQLASNNNSARLVLIGSAAEYGSIKPFENPVLEDHTLNPTSIYGLTKVAQTHIANFYSSVRNVDIVICRVFNLYGFGFSKKLFVGNAAFQIEQYKKGEIKHLVFGSLCSERDYLTTSEAARMIVTIANNGIQGTVYNVGSGFPIKIKTVLTRLLNDSDLAEAPIIEMQHSGFGSSADTSCIFADIRRFQSIEKL